MKRSIFAILPLLVGCASVHTDIVIEAEPEEVWAVILDTHSYPEWNPVMTEVSGQHKIGKTLSYQVKVPGEEASQIKAKVKAMVANSLLRQTGGIWAVLTFDHQYKLEKIDGGTKVSQREEYSGVGLLFWDHKKMELAYQESNEALKSRVLQLKKK